MAILVAVTAGCLPEGPPPAGVQIVADRHAALGTLVPPNGDGMLRVLLLRPGATSDSVDLSVVSLDQDNRPSPELPLISGVDAIYGVGCGIYGLEPCAVDSTGTVRILKADHSWINVNAITGEIDSLPQNPGASLPSFSTPGGRSFQRQSQTTGTLTDADGHATTLQLTPSNVYSAGPCQFLGEDFYYLDPQQNLIDIPPSDVPQQLATAVMQFNGWTTPDGPVLILGRSTASYVLDVNAGTETMLPFDGSSSTLSGDGRWVLHSDPQTPDTFVFFDYRSGSQQTVQIDGNPVGRDWRPGTSELWVTAFGAGADDPHAVWIVRPDAPAVSVPGAYLEYVFMNERSAQPFTDDGVYWFYTTTSLDSATQVVQVARTDDPTGPAFPLNPPSTFLNLALPLEDGRMLTTSYPKDQDRSDVTAVDPRTGASDTLARRGFFLTSGQSRFMGLFHIAETRGDLTTVNLDTEQVTVLAPEFAVTAAAEPQGADRLAPGTRIVYQFQARTASSYDGIWVATTP
ncbi:MAG TPA: hypothetical protein VN962_00585 [Polyangia bacterium]|nr:hypothetical protein [Polyangia bacterium]